MASGAYVVHGMVVSGLRDSLVLSVYEIYSYEELQTAQFKKKTICRRLQNVMSWARHISHHVWQ